MRQVSNEPSVKLSTGPPVPHERGVAIRVAGAQAVTRAGWQAAGCNRAGLQAAAKLRSCCGGGAQGLQPYVMQTVTVCDGGCNRIRRRLQPYVTEAVTVCGGGCNRMWRRLYCDAQGPHRGILPAKGRGRGWARSKDRKIQRSSPLAVRRRLVGRCGGGCCGR